MNLLIMLHSNNPTLIPNISILYILGIHCIQKTIHLIYRREEYTLKKKIWKKKILFQLIIIDK
jgi:hypothetical protein